MIPKILYQHLYFYTVNQTIKNIKAIREKLKIKQSYLADFVGMDRSSFSKMEKLKLNLSVDVLIGISKIFKMSIDEIVHYHENEYKPMEKESIVKEEKEPYLIMNERNNFLKTQNEELKEQLKSFQFLATSASEYNKRLMNEADELKEKLKLCEARLAAIELKS